MKRIYVGNVHEIYSISNDNDRLVIVSTDRISALGHLLPVEVKNKGKILTTMSNFWFHKTKNIISNHLIESDVKKMPEFFQREEFENRTILVEKLNIIPFEFIVRGYMYGRLWNAYKQDKKLCGYEIKGNYELAEKLREPIVTPTTKRENMRDSNVSLDDVESELGTELTKKIVETCMHLYYECSKYALSKGIIIADTKFEFGLNRNNELILADEIFTPDSSRFWDINKYKKGTEPQSYDKQIIRDWLGNNKVDNQICYENIPEIILNKTENVYNACLEKLCGVKIS